MRLEWLLDILAIIETGSMSRAAEERLLTQPAFSRRMRVIEDYVGVELLDRSRKPAQLKRSVRDRRARIQELATGLRDLVNELKRHDRETQNRIVIASQHAITTSFAPPFVKHLAAEDDISIRLRSANRDECLALLMTHEADIALLYRSEAIQIDTQDDYLETRDLGEERLIPVFATDQLNRLEEERARVGVPVISYPSDVFLGELVNQEVFVGIGTQAFVRKKAETALTLAAKQLALAGVGIAWLPESLAGQELTSGTLTNLDYAFPSPPMRVVAIRLPGEKSSAEDQVWSAIAATSGSDVRRKRATVVPLA